MTKSAKVALVIASALILSGCFIPEKFDANIQFNEDATLNYTYDGTIVLAQLASEKIKSGVISDKTKASIPKVIAEIKRNPSTKSVEQANDTTFKVVLEGKNQNSNIFSLMDFIKVYKDKSGIISVFTPILAAKDIKELQQLGVSLDGTLKVVLPKNATVIESNAQSNPSFGGLVSGYTWKLKKFDDKVVFKFKLN